MMKKKVKYSNTDTLAKQYTLLFVLDIIQMFIGLLSLSIVLVFILLAQDPNIRMILIVADIICFSIFYDGYLNYSKNKPKKLLAVTNKKINIKKEELGTII